MRLRRFAKRWKLRSVYMVAVFCVMSFSISTIFSAISEGAEVVSPERRIATASTNGKAGVSSPVSIQKMEEVKSTKAVLGASTNKQIFSQIPPKPSWVTMPLYTDPNNGAAQYIAKNPSINGASYIERMAKVPVAQWFGDWNSNVKVDVDNYVAAAAAKRSVPVVVVYNIPHRDCGGYSTGGANNFSSYTKWIEQVAAGIGNRTAVVILEPDALGALNCLPSSQRQERTQSIAQAVTILKAHAQTAVYIDAGTPVWQPVNVMASRLKIANVAAANGFSLNVSYFSSTAKNRTYGNQLSSLIGNKHYVIDTSRNGANHAVTGMQCNPSFAALGEMPTTNTGSALNDALLWIKIPWESDGSCNGSPGPGEGYWSYAVELAKNAGW
ncbi:MAG: glycoside hydrolase family 6 protein [Candidatus Nomurabacteria bacterium]|nr:MAG: glycoside hydrolase family 6 protein [Candidatus Nomurabacteria bacterium]